MWAGSLIICSSPSWEVTASMLKPSKIVVSPVYRLLGFTLKSPMVTIQKGLIAEKASRVNSKLSQIFLNLSTVWFGDLYKEIELQILSPSFMTKVIQSLR